MFEIDSLVFFVANVGLIYISQPVNHVTTMKVFDCFLILLCQTDEIVKRTDT